MSPVTPTLLAACLLGAGAPQAPAAGGGAPRPNVVLILADDLGFSDLGCFGSEIATPNLDALAASGVRLTRLYSAARCCPSRASLMTGLYAHQVGIGWMTETPEFGQAGIDHGDFGTDAYRGRLALDVPTLADGFHAAGYRTLMAGKWHLGAHAPAYRPLHRGFDRYFGFLAGAISYVQPGAPRGLSSGDDPVEPVPTRAGVPFYTTDAFTDHAIEFLREADAQDDARPFFLYLAFNAPHWPLQALPEDLARYRHRYDAGWDALRAERHARMVALGLVSPDWQLPPRDGPAWDDLPPERKEEMALKMATYAAQVDRLDQDVGRLLGALDELGERENTVVLFLSDNGACSEGGTFGFGSRADLDTVRGWSGTSYGRMWAQVSNTPFRGYKSQDHEGGIASPGIFSWPAALPADAAGGLRTVVGGLPDVLPTLLDAARARPPGPTEGRSLLPALLHGTPLPERALFWEHQGNAAVREGDWKLVRLHRKDGAWELHDLARDRTEEVDLAAEQPDRVRAMAAAWKAWADRVGVLPWRGPKAMRVHRADAGQKPGEKTGPGEKAGTGKGG